MFCKYCGKEIENNSNYCRHCGKPTNERNDFVESIRIRIDRLDTTSFKEEEKHLCFIVFSKDQLSITIVEDIKHIDLYDCFAIIALLRCDCRNGFGFHYNHFFNLGFFDKDLQPISKLMIGAYSVEDVNAANNTPRWGYIKAKRREDYYYFHIYRDTKLIKWQDEW